MSAGSIRLDADDVLAEVRQERGRQDVEHGGPEHDDAHGPGDWCNYIEAHNLRARVAGTDDAVSSDDTWRYQMVRVAALAVAAVEAHDRRTA